VSNPLPPWRSTLRPCIIAAVVAAALVLAGFPGPFAPPSTAASVTIDIRA
jgi:hypothetical protein